MGTTSVVEVIGGIRMSADLSYIVEALRAYAVPIGDMVTDPANARKHDEKNLQAIKASLRVYGQRQPIVVNKRTGHVEAGNGRLEAALALGWSHIAAVYVDDDPTTAAGFSIADNRTAELAEWDPEALDSLLRTIQTEDQELADMLAVLAEQEKIIPPEDDHAEPTYAPEGLEYRLLVSCRDEKHQTELLERLEGEGLSCRPLIS